MGGTRSQRSISIRESIVRCAGTRARRAFRSHVAALSTWTGHVGAGTCATAARRFTARTEDHLVVCNHLSVGPFVRVRRTCGGGEANRKGHCSNQSRYTSNREYFSHESEVTGPQRLLQWNYCGSSNEVVALATARPKPLSHSTRGQAHADRARQESHVFLR